MGIRPVRFGWLLALSAILLPVSSRSIVRADEPGEGGDPMGGDEPGGGDLGGGDAPVDGSKPMDPELKAKLDKEVKRVIDMFKKMIHSADLSIINEFLKFKGNREFLSADPANCASLCMEAAAFLARAGKDQLEEAEKIAENFVGIAKKCVDTHKDDRTAKVALAAAKTAAIRLDLAQKKAVTPERFVEVADLLVAAYEGGAADSGSYLAIGLSWVREGVDEVEAARAPLIERVDKLLLAIPTLPQGTGRDIAMAQARFLRAVSMGPAKGKPDAEACIATLEPYVAGDQPRADAMTIHNEVVSWARRAKTPLKANYLFKSASVLGNGLGYKILSGSRWEDRGSDGALFVILETNARGRVVREIQGEDYRWDRNYIFDDDGKEEKFGGDNAKGLAKKFLADAKSKKFTSITGKKDLMKAPFAKNLNQAQMFEVTGTGSDGDYLRLRGYIFKAKEAMLTYVVLVYEYGDFPKNDPELDAFLDNMFEKPKTKGK